MSNGTPLKNVFPDTFAIMAAIILGTHRSFEDLIDREDWRSALEASVGIAADLITLVQRFDWEKHEKEMQLPKGEQ